jgi:hypothetical protein
MQSFNEQEDLLRNQLRNPKSEGEKAQVDKIRKLSEDPDEIIQFKKDLINTKEKYAKKYSDNETGPERSEINLRTPEPPVRKTTQKRRRADQKAFQQERPGFFQVLVNLLSLISLFKSKYSAEKKIRFSFFNYFTNGSFFFPDYTVFKFARTELIPILETLKPIAREMYDWGWCDAHGKRVLDPYGFNLISQFERLLDKRILEEALVHQYAPEKIIESLNNFTKQYFTLIVKKENRKLLAVNVKKILGIMQEAEVREISQENIRLFTRLMDELFEKPVEQNFLVPIFESHMGRPLAENEYKNWLETEPLSSSEYYADPRLMAAMRVKEEAYEKYLSGKIHSLKSTLALIAEVRNDLEFKVVKGKELFFNLIDYAVQKKYSTFKGFPVLEDLLPHQKCFFCTLFFVDTYDSFLSKDLKVKKDLSEQKTVDIRLFDHTLFENDLDHLFNSTDQLKRIAEKGYRGDIFSPSVEEKDISKEHKNHLNILNNIADIYFSIGIKINKYFSNEAKVKDDARPLTEDQLGKIISAYDQYLIFQIPSKKDFREGYYFFQKRIRDILTEIRAFCFQYTYNFEYQFRKFKFESQRKKTLKKLLSEKVILEKIQKSLESGEDVDLNQ